MANYCIGSMNPVRSDLSGFLRGKGTCRTRDGLEGNVQSKVQKKKAGSWSPPARKLSENGLESLNVGSLQTLPVRGQPRIQQPVPR